MGAVLGRAVRTSAGTASHDPVTWTFYGLGLVATLAVTVLTTRMARQSWKAYYGPQTMVEEHFPETTKPAEAPGVPKVVTGSLSKSYRLPNGTRSLVRRPETSLMPKGVGFDGCQTCRPDLRRRQITCRCSRRCCAESRRFAPGMSLPRVRAYRSEREPDPLREVGGRRSPLPPAVTG